jgi:Ca2+-binding RTX toxin-like protein
MAIDTVLGGTGTASSISVGGIVNGTIDAGGDQDWYRVTLVAGQQYRFNLQGVSGVDSPLADPYLRLLTGAGTEVAYNDDAAGTLNSSITFTAITGGTYYLSAQGFGSSIGSFSLAATNITSGAGDVPAGTSSSSSVAPGGSVVGMIDAGGDQDWYRVTLTAGHQYRFDLQGSSSGQGTLADPYLRLLNSAGTQLSFNDDAASSLDSSITFSVATSGTYFLAVQAYDGNDFGTFRLRATDVTASGAGDIPANAGTGGSVAMGATVAGTIHQAGDEDWYRVTLAAGHEYRFDLRGLASGQGTLDDPLLRLLNGSGTEIAFNDDSGGSLDSRITYTATQGGTYFLSAQGFSESAGTFRLSATDLGTAGSDVRGNTNTTAAITIGGSRTGTINPGGDQDWYRVSLVEGHEYRFDLRGSTSGEGTLTDPVLRLLNGSGNVIESNDDSVGTLDSSIAYTATATRTYFLSAQGYQSSTGTFRLSATELTGGAGDVPASTGTGGAVAIGGLVSGAVETGGDQDWYRVTLVSGHQYRFNLHGADTDQGTLDDPYLRLLNSSGFEIRFDDDSGNGRESRITYTAPASGAYYLSAESYAGYSIGTFVLSATDLTAGSGDIAGGTGTSGRVFVGGSVSGTIGRSGDEDWYRVTLLEGRQYRFELSGFDSDLGTLADPYLRLLNRSGGEIDFDDDSGPGLESNLVFTAPRTDTYYLSAEGYAGYSTGTFRLSVSDAGTDVAGGIGTSRTVPLGDAVAGRINAAGDQDWYRVTLTAGHQYAFDLQGEPSDQGTLDDPLLRLLDSTGAALGFDDDSGQGFDASILFNAPETGTYYLSAQGYSSSVGTFALGAFDLDDPRDVLAEAGTGSSLPMQGAVTGTINPSGDEDWFQVELVAGRQYRFDLQGSDSDDGSLVDPYLRLLDRFGARVAFDDDSGAGLNSRFTYTAGYTGTYFLSAEAFGDSRGTFLLGATDLSAGTGDVRSNSLTASMLAVGGSIRGTIAANGDEDWYRVFLRGGHEYHFDLRGGDSEQGTLADPYLRLLNNSGAEVDFDDDSGVGRDSSLVYTPAQNAYYFLAASDYALLNNGTFVLSASDGPPDVLASTGTNGTLVVGGSVASTLDVRGDEDWYRVLLLAGHEYQFDLQGLDSLQGTLADPYLRLLNGNGAELPFPDGYDDDSGAGRDSSLTYSASRSGYYYVSAQAYEGTIPYPGETGSFVLNVIDLGASDVAANIATGGAITINGSVAGAIDAAGDEDWYRVTLTAGHQYRFELQGLDSGEGTLQDPFLRLLDNSGGEIATDDDSGAGLEARITFTAGATGTYYLSAEDYWLSYTGTFTLSITDLAGAEVPGNTGTGAAVVAGGSVAGTIGGGGDQDWYRIALISGHEYHFELRGVDSAAGTLTDPYLRLLNNSGVEIDFDDDSGTGRDSSITHIATVTGNHFLAAQHFATGSGTFVLSVTDLTGGTVSERTFIGTSAGNDLTGSEFDDLVQGLAGDDRLDGKGGDDTLGGGTGADDLGGGLGDDSVLGGDGNDVFLQLTVESVGDDTLAGGAGADAFHDHFGRNVLNGGEGADLFEVYIGEAGSTNLVTGGSGQDVYQLQPRTLATVAGAYVVTDFECGIGGDFLNVSALLDASAEDRFLDPDDDASDFVRLIQSGLDTVLQWDRDGPGANYTWRSYLTLKNVEADKVGSENILGIVDVGTKRSEALDGTLGNDLLAAAEGNDTLDGGAGMDVMFGGNGRDLYYVDDMKDVVLESSAALPAGALAGLAIDDASWTQLLAAIGDDPAKLDQLTDTVIAVVNYSLENVEFVEDLTLSDTATEGTGNGLNNVLTGNARANVLSGLAGNDTISGVGGSDTLVGGAGKDVLRGAAGQDTFDFNTALNASTNVDRIMDFSVAADLIRLDDDVFRALATGTLAAAAFDSGPNSTARDASDRIIYNETNGNLYYDADGTGAAAPKLFATLAGAPAIDASNFLIVA